MKETGPGQVDYKFFFVTNLPTLQKKVSVKKGTCKKKVYLEGKLLSSSFEKDTRHLK